MDNYQLHFYSIQTLAPQDSEEPNAANWSNWKAKFSQILVPLSPQSATGKAYAKRLNDESEIAGRLLRRSSYRC
jgi:hypothetical protein